MKFDLSLYFDKYEALLELADTAFSRVKAEHTSCVRCKIECSDCCYALFDLSLIEALYINFHFNSLFAGKKRAALIEKASSVDRTIYRIKRKAHQAFKNGMNENEILAALAMERVRCPLLNAGNRCDLYKYRPITCRVYGIPTSINGRGHTCSLSAFIEGEKYPSVNLDHIQQKLFDLSDELVKGIRSKYVKMSDLLVPLSMAIITDYNDSYLGIEHE